MIDFRYHVVSIIAVFLALALGLFVGSTSLQDAVVHTITSKADKVSRQNDALKAQVSNLHDTVKNDESFDRALLPFAVSGRLSGQVVSVISAPGTSDSTRKQVIAAIAAAGGTVSADVRLQNAIVAPQQDAFLSALTERVTIPGHPADPTADGAARAAGQLAAVLGVRPTAHAVPATTTETVLAAYTTGKLISVANTPTPRAGTLAVLLAGPTPVAGAGADPVSVKAQQVFLLDLLSSLDETSLGAVVAAPMPVPGTAGDVTAAAATSGLTKRISTVAGIDTAAGQIAMVFALAAQVDGTSGKFGPTQPGSPLPAPSGTP